MAIITISRGMFSGGKELAECVAQRLEYQCVSDEILVEAARKYDAPLDKLTGALTDKPGIFEGMKLERAHYLAYITASLVNYAKTEELVYHGHAGHLLLKNAPHVLRVKVMASMEHRVEIAMSDRQFSTREQAAEFIQKSDNTRSRWEKFIYHVDWSDISLYDLVIDINRLGLSGACDVICFIAEREEYLATPESQKSIKDLLLAANVRAMIASEANVRDDEIEVEANNGIITISGSVPTTDDADIIRETVLRNPRVSNVVSHLGARWTVDRG